MFKIDFTKIDNYPDTFNQCSIQISGALSLMKNSIIPFIDGFTELTKKEQSIIIDNIVKTTSDITYLLKTVHNLEINSGNNKQYLSEETH